MKKILQKISKKILAFPKKVLVFLVRGIFTIMKFIFNLPKNFWKFCKKLLHIIKNPKLILTAFLLMISNVKKFFKKFPRRIKEYFFLLIMSAQGNVWRLEKKRVLDIPTIGEIKEYQKHLRKKTFGWVFTSAMAVMLVFSLPGLFQKYFTHAKTYSWAQNNWSLGLASPTTSPVVGTAANNWNEWKYSSSIGPLPKSIDVGPGGPSGSGTAGQIALHPYTTQTAQENGTTTGAPNYPYSGINSGTYATGGGTTQGVVTLKKSEGAACGPSSSDGVAGPSCTMGKCVNEGSSVYKCFPNLLDGYHLDSNGNDINTSNPNNLTGHTFTNWDTTLARPTNITNSTDTASANITTGTWLAPSTAINLGSLWTVAAWVYCDGSTTAYYDPLLSDGGSSNVAVGLWEASGVGCYATAGGFADNSAPLSGQNYWTLFVAVGSSGSTHFYGYTQGAWHDYGTFAHQIIGSMTYIGNTSAGTSPIGHIDELLIFNRALTYPEVQALLPGW